MKEGSPLPSFFSSDFRNFYGKKFPEKGKQRIMSFKTKSAAAAISLLTGLSCLTGCSTKSAENDAEKEIEAVEDSGTSEKTGEESTQPIEYTVQVNADTTSILNGSLEYVPFSSADRSQIGTKIGSFRFSEDEPVEDVYELIGQSSEQWIIAAGPDETHPMIYREMSVTEYPEGFVSEYPWN